MVASTTMTKTQAEIEAYFKQHGQEHVLEHLPELSDADKQSFLEQLSAIELEKIPSIAELKSTLAKQEEESANQSIAPLTERVAYSSNVALVAEVEPLGLQAIQNGLVAALVLAGGQGTRLGFDHPKGMYNIGLPSGRTLFQMIVERLLRLKQLAKADKNIPLYVMTSPINHEETVTFFEGNNCFGMDRADLIFFQQGVLPCFDSDNKIILEAPGRVAVAPDGNGGIYPSLEKSGSLADMEKRGIQHLHVFAIDNSLVKPADPVFLGYCLSQLADCGNKVCWKTNAHEKVGVVAARDNKPCVIEYSEITKEMAEQEDDNGRLVFGAGNICERMAIWDVTRAEEFAPVKNAPGSPSDSPYTARAAISNLAKAWIQQAGGRLTGNQDSDQCEISPLTSYAGEGLEELVKDKEVTCPFSL